jgi:GNAT superfamily N-acetyltransferase
MDKFVPIINTLVTAEQIADLLNKHNKLQVIHTKHTILSSPINYLIQQGVINNNLVVVGCVGLSKEDETTTLLQHLVVDESYRQKGIATKLLNYALSSVNTKFVKMRIRHTNIPSLCLSSKLGFHVDDCVAKDNYYILIVKKGLT